MKFVALLRGINVGGNNIIKMSELKQAFENLGFKNVTTYINSGNVIFESEDKALDIREKIETNLLKFFKLDLRAVVIPSDKFKKVLNNIPKEWDLKDLRCYVAFVREPITEKDVLKEVQLKEGIDFVKTEKGVLYMASKLSGISKSGFTKLIGTKIYKDITIRNLNTVKKIYLLIS